MGKIVVGYVDAPGARNALERSIELAQRFGDELVIVFAVAPPGPGGEEFAEHRRALEEVGRRVTAEALERAREAGVAAEVVLAPERPSAALLSAAEDHDARYIAVGSTGEGPIKGAILGSTPHKLLHVADRPVLVVPG